MAFSLERIASSSPVHDETHLDHWQSQALRARGPQWLLEEFIKLDSSITAKILAMNLRFLHLLLEDISGACLTVLEVLESSKWLLTLLI